MLKYNPFSRNWDIVSKAEEPYAISTFTAVGGESSFTNAVLSGVILLDITVNDHQLDLSNNEAVLAGTTVNLFQPDGTPLILVAGDKVGGHYKKLNYSLI